MTGIVPVTMQQSGPNTMFNSGVPEYFSSGL
jgi:hypothetical protein